MMALKRVFTDTEASILSPVPDWSLYLLLVTLTVLAYANSFPAAFIGDDLSIVANNSLVAQIDLSAIFTTDYWGPVANSGLFRPLTILSFGVERAFWGTNANLVHALNLVLHLGVSLLICVVFQYYGIARRHAWLAAVLFALHPIHTEVANLAVGRAELLATVGVLGALWACSSSQKALCWGLAPFVYLLGLLSKENAIVLLGLLPVLDYFAGNLNLATWRKRLSTYALLVGVTAIWLVWRSWGVVRTVPADGYDSVYTPLAFLPPLERILTALKYQWLYLRKLLLPYDLQGIYSGETFFKPIQGLLSAESILILVATALLFCGAGWSFWRKKPFSLGLLFYLIAVTPAANLFFVSGVTFAERLLYLPSIGFCLLLAGLLIRCGRWCGQRGWLAMAVVCLSLFLGLLVQRNFAFRTPQSLWTHDVQRDEQNVLAWFFLANAEAAAGNSPQAVKAYRQMRGLAPHFAEGAVSYAQFLLDRGAYQEALEVALPIAEKPDAVYPEIYLILGRAYVALEKYTAALSWLEKAPAFYRNYGIYWEYRGRALEGLGDRAGAIQGYQRMGAFPKGSSVPGRLGKLLLQAGQVEEARRQLEIAVQYRPLSASSWNSLGVSHAMLGHKKAAQQAFLQATRLAPENQQYRENLERSEAK